MTLIGIIFLFIGLYEILKSGSRSIALMDTVVALISLFNFSMIGHICSPYELVRCIYFFVLGAEIKGDAVDYILAVFPSFLYLSAFTLVLSYWYV